MKLKIKSIRSLINIKSLTIFSIFIILLISGAAYSQHTKNQALETAHAAELSAKNKLEQQKKEKAEADKKLEQAKLAEQQKQEQEKLAEQKAQEEQAKQKQAEEEKQKQAEQQKQKEEDQKAIQQSSQKQQSASTTNKPAAAPAQQAAPAAPAQQNYIVNSLNTGNSNQVVVVYTDGYGEISGTCETFQKSNGVWQRALNPFPINVGAKGFAPSGQKREGDMRTPSGKFGFGGMMFGRLPNPGVNYTYKQVDDNDYWVDDSNSSYYNQYKRGSGGFSSAERLDIASYNYAAVIDYNSSRTPNMGSAIFFHVWGGPGHGTAGCVATDQQTLTSFLKWLNPSQNPIIIMGVKSQLPNF